MLKAAIPLLLGLLLAGVCRREEVWILLGLFILWRLFALFAEWRRSRLQEPDWVLRDRVLREEFGQYWQAVEEWRQLETPLAEGAVPRAVPSQLDITKAAASQVQREQAGWNSRRPVGDLIAECVGLAGYTIILPLAVFLWRDDFFSFRRYSSWVDLGLLAGGLLLYGLPHWKHRLGSSVLWLRTWWVLPSVVSALFAAILVSEKHPYLNVFRSDRRQLAAEKILSMRDNIVAESHADWVTDHAYELAGRGEDAEAIRLCGLALRLRPGMVQAERLLARLGASPHPTEPLVAPDAPYFAGNEAPPKAVRTRIGPELENVAGCTLVLVSMGTVGDDVLDYVAAVVDRECGIPVMVYERVLPLPEHTRRRGLAGGAQWSCESLVNALQPELGGRWPRAPIRYLVITSADLYLGSANFVYSASAEWGAIAATGQFVKAGGDANLLKHRLAKQALSALIKSFGVPPSGDRRCVTSYPADLRQLDEKGNHPLPDTLEAFRSKVREINEAWETFKAQQKQVP